MEKRIEWIDALKGFGIFCVTLGHLSCWFPLETHIYSFHMFLFFFISGYLLNSNTSTTELIKKRCLSLFLPFLTWNLLCCLIGYSIGMYTIKESLQRLFIIDGNLCWNAPIWFLLVLFYTETLYALIHQISKNKYTTLIVLVASIILWGLIGKYKLTLEINLIPLALVFYSFGIVYKSIEARNIKAFQIQVSKIILIIICGVFSVVFGTILNIRISYTGASFGNVIYCIIAGISGVIFYVMLFQYFSEKFSWKYLRILGKNSFVIMVTQFFFFFIFDKISNTILGISIWHSRGMIKALVVTVITITLIFGFLQLYRLIAHRSKVIYMIGTLFGIK